MKTKEEILSQRFNTTPELLDTNAHCRVSSALIAMEEYADQFKQKDDLLHHLTDEQLFSAMENYHREQTKQIPE